MQLPGLEHLEVRLLSSARRYRVACRGPRAKLPPNGRFSSVPAALCWVVLAPRLPRSLNGDTVLGWRSSRLALQQRRGSDLEGERRRGVVARSSNASLAKRVADGAFWGYVGIAVSALLFQAAQDHRFGRSVARARLCTAQLDSICVSRELEVQGSIRKADPRMELAAASLSLLLHRPIEPAQATADRFEAAQSADITAMPAELRADLLLLRSDIAR
jgi:hypothetical protein